jgi:hypothetical protein
MAWPFGPCQLPTPPWLSQDLQKDAKISLLTTLALPDKTGSQKWMRPESNSPSLPQRLVQYKRAREKQILIGFLPVENTNQ